MFSVPGGSIYARGGGATFGKLSQLNYPFLSAKVSISLSVKACVHWFIPHSAEAQVRLKSHVENCTLIIIKEQTQTMSLEITIK